MKTTVEIEDRLLREIKRRGAERGQSLRQMVNLGLRLVLQERSAQGKYRMKDCSVGGRGLVREYGWEEIRELIYPAASPGGATE